MRLRLRTDQIKGGVDFVLSNSQYSGEVKRVCVSADIIVVPRDETELEKVFDNHHRLRKKMGGGWRGWGGGSRGVKIYFVSKRALGIIGLGPSIEKY